MYFLKSKDETFPAFKNFKIQSERGMYIIWLRTDYGGEYDGISSHQTVVVFGDKQGAIALAKNPQYIPRTKHTSIQNHWIRERIDGKEVALVYIPTDQQTADSLTKPLTKDCFLAFRAALGLEE